MGFQSVKKHCNCLPNSTQQKLNRLRCLLDVDLCWTKEPFITIGPDCSKKGALAVFVIAKFLVFDVNREFLKNVSLITYTLLHVYSDVVL